MHALPTAVLAGFDLAAWELVALLVVAAAYGLALAAVAAGGALGIAWLLVALAGRVLRARRRRRAVL